MHRRLVTLALATAALLLSACGGGGGAGSPDVPGNPDVPSDTSGQHVKVSGATEAEWTSPNPVYVTCMTSQASSCLFLIIDDDGVNTTAGLAVALGTFPTVRTYQGNGVDESEATTEVVLGLSGPTWYLEHAVGSYTLTFTSVGTPSGDTSSGPTTYQVHGSYHAVVPASANGATGDAILDWTF